jgi:hypothetical protein
VIIPYSSFQILIDTQPTTYTQYNAENSKDSGDSEDNKDGEDDEDDKDDKNGEVYQGYEKLVIAVHIKPKVERNPSSCHTSSPFLSSPSVTIHIVYRHR